MTSLDHVDSLDFFLAPVVLVGLILLVILADLRRGVAKSWIAGISVVGLLGTLAIVVLSIVGYPKSPIAGLQENAAGGEPVRLLEGPARLFQGALAYDGFALFFQAAFVGAALLVALYSWPVVKKWRDGQGEYYAILLSLLFAMFLMSMAQTLLMMFLSIEFASISSFLLAGMLRKDRKSAEAALKYIIYSASASGVMLFGMSLLYGLTGTLDVAEIGRRLNGDVVVSPTTLVVASVLTMSGFGYKIAAVPFHLWCPDVYEGAPTPVAAFFSVGPKAAGLAVLARFLSGLFPAGADGVVQAPAEWTFVLALLSVLTMGLGNLAALWQNNLKRLLAYSSIAHAGYLLLGFTVLKATNLGSIAFYAFIYVVMNLGAFFCVIVLEERYGITTVDGCKGIGNRLPRLCGMMTLFLVALTGIPPTGGFTAKLVLFAYVMKEGGNFGTGLVVVAVIFSVVSLGYYAKVFGAMFLAKPREDLVEARLPASQGVVLWVLAAATLVLGLWWGWLYDLAAGAGEQFLR